MVPLQTPQTGTLRTVLSVHDYTVLKLPLTGNQQSSDLFTETSSYDMNKKFWEGLIAYFPSYDTGHIENDASHNSSIVTCAFVTSVTFLPSLATIGGFLPSRCLAKIRGFLPGRCLEMIVGYTHRHNDR
jgi:hypothetical protein